MSNNTILKAPKRMGYEHRMTGHGFRGIASPILHKQGHRHDVIELQLAHQERNAIEKQKLSRHNLTVHWRIGPKIARVADRLQPPEEGAKSLEDSCNYDVKLFGESSAKLHDREDRDAQFSRMLNLIRIQLDAYAGENIGIFCGRIDTVREIKDRFNSTDLASIVVAYGVDEGANFTSGKQIHIMTLHSSKGTEFRAVHIFGAEELTNRGLRRTRLSYTGVTRAKTSLNVYRSGDTTVKLEHAFAEPRHFSLEDLLPDTE